MESARIELQKSLVNEISKGMGQVKQLKVSCSEQERVVERMLSSYEEALFILTGRAPQGQCQSVITSSSNPKPPTGSSPSAHKGGSRSAQKRRRAIQRLVNVKAADDVYSWRKYGEKPILNSIYPRSYYRCQAKSCEAKKQVQRSGNDPSTFHVTYTGVHTCQPNSPSSNMGNIEQDQENFNFPPEAFGDPVMSLNAIVADLELDQLMGDLPMNF